MKPPIYYPGKVLRDGYLYVGIAYDEDKKMYYRLAMEPRNEDGEINWFDAMEKFGPKLPTRYEQSMLMNMPKSARPTADLWYWSSTEYNTSIAWVQRFSDGCQSYSFKNSAYRVRCVRRFGHFKIEEDAK